MPASVLAPGSDVICAVGPYPDQVAGPGAAEINRYMREHAIDTNDEGAWVLLWKRGPEVHSRRFGRRPVDLVNNDAAFDRRAPRDLRVADCAVTERAVLLKQQGHGYDRVPVVLAERVTP